MGCTLSKVEIRLPLGRRQIFLSVDRAHRQVRLGWVRLSWFDLYINRLEQELKAVEDVARALGCITDEVFREHAMRFWLDDYIRLEWRARREGVGSGVLRDALHHAPKDMARACRVLSTALQIIYRLRAKDLARHLRRFRIPQAFAFRASRVGGFALHNLISLQRRFYLHHGAHPTEQATLSRGLQISVGGLMPASL